MAKTITLEVSRYSPEQDFEPRFQSYEVPVKEEWVILDALNYIKDKIDGTLTFRWSCRMGICGSCGYTIDNEPKLGCATFLSKYLPGPVRIEPLRNFPVVRDLVIEMSEFLEKLKKVKPWLIHEDGNGGGEYLQTPDQLEEFRQHSMCINCLLCYAACPISGLDPVFIGPAALALAIVTTRTRAIKGRQSAWRCSHIPRASGDARSWASVRGFVPNMSTLRARFSNTSLQPPSTA